MYVLLSSMWQCFPRIADQYSLFRNIISKPFCQRRRSRRPVAKRQKALSSQRHTYQFLNIQASRIITRHFIPPTAGMTLFRMCSQVLLSMSTLQPRWPTVVHITWTNATRSGLTEITRKPGAKVQVRRALFRLLLRASLREVQRPKARNRKVHIPWLCPRTNSSLSWVCLRRLLRKRPSSYTM